MPDTDVRFRPAVAADLTAIVRMLADDPLGRGRETVAEPLPPGYAQAFAAVAASPDNTLIVAEQGGEVVGCLQLTLIPGLSRQGALRGQIESVRVRADRRGHKIGEGLVAHAVEHARAAGAKLVQLTTDRSRADAHRFYERLGFVASHVGMKLSLE